MDRHRFIGETPSGTAVLAYTPAGAGALDLYSTYVPPGDRGRGLGAELVGAAVAFARAQGLRLIPTCWYVAEWLAAHPEDADLFARDPDPGV
jgi:predicted GNAT family acetyltransferase